MFLVKVSLALSVATALNRAAQSAHVSGYSTTSDDEAKAKNEVALNVNGVVKQHVPASKPGHALVALPTTDAEVATPDISGVSMRCRFCGAHLAWKHHYQHLPDDSKARAKNTRAEASLGENGEVVYFDNPAGVEFELASFVDSAGVPSDTYTQQDTFFDSYNWRVLACPRCAKHVGWKFTHVLQDQCMVDSERQLHRAATPSPKKGSHAKLAAQVEAAFGERKCHAMSNGWWSYQHCYKSEITQFHLEADGTKSSDWSLGHFTDDRSTDAEIIHHFTGGQHCDENGKLRSTTVKFVCCPEQPDVSVDTIEEPSLCTYLMRVCVPNLCLSKPKTPDALDKKIEQACAQSLIDHQTTSSTTPFLPLFYTLVWPETIAEDNPELQWAHSLSTITSIVGR
ncbi:hypothetical protein H310_13990 [Aphanomyces invadans]|uniref:Uncharacterized protein n=1 Tax=Aphanomyces invadans TaxID=157072 RepID=A0A024TDR0_9STRA|nr:hypothetical protein H310_13990 [Aphanomyces invadans]ETV91447.1 hypothetical protein H310_13990 [Aphanomyces invadans]|eukprot:XP_008879899.1 hypothetical protein H310_13990 [Aphanomyces invadans]